tara:strand:+ start:7511 stop:8728 length:1218 start_codon:yes stop_codon:yes gene_type:complete
MRETKYSNGVNLITERIPGIRSVAIGVWLKQGSAHESSDFLGISHILEHLVFKGTKQRDAREIALSLESLGGMLNAYTAREHTGYQALVLDEHLPEALDVLADLVLYPRLDPEDLELERAVVLEEIASVEDAPDDLIFDLHSSRFWKGHPYGQMILGTRETVSVLEIDDVCKLHEDKYTGNNIIVACAGDIDHEVVASHVAKLFGDASSGEICSDVDAPLENLIGRDLVVRNTAQAHLVFGNQTPPHMDPICEALILISSAFGGGMSSRLFQRIREEMALAYSVFAYQSFYSRAGITGVYVGTRPENSSKALESILAEYNLLYKEGLMALELEQIKAQVKGQMIISMESTVARLLRLAGYALRGEPYKNLEESLARIDAVTLEEVNEACTRFFDPEDQYVMSMGP